MKSLQEMLSVNWRTYADWAKRRPGALKIADWLGRGRGRFRFMDRLAPVPPAPLRPDLTEWHDQELAAAWIGHATVLLRVGGLNILTDPVFARRVGVGLGVMTGGPTRHYEPALKLRELPKLDLILISHAHFDHLDRPTLSRLPKDVPVVAPNHTCDLIQDLGFRAVVEIGWGESVKINGVKITGCEVKHWGARTFYDDYRGYCGYMIDAGNRRVLFGADTAFGRHFEGLGKVDLACLGIGAYNPYVAAHATPEQALRMADDVHADFILPMHHSTFKLSYEPMHEPIERMMTAVGRDEQRIVVKDVGGQWALA